LLFTILAVFPQDDDLFLCKYTPTASGANIVFSKKKDAFKLSIPGQIVKPAKLEKTPDPNQHFFDVDGMTLQLSLVPLPESVPKTWHLNSLTLDQQKEILLGYVDYEMDYLKNELKVPYTSLTQKGTTINGKVFIAWMFEQPKIKNVANPVIGQLYVAAICYHQVLTINTPLFDKPDYRDKASKLAVDISGTLKFYELP